jgi:hypothetical protein
MEVIRTQELIDGLAKRSFAFMAAISFEERSITSANFLQKHALCPDEVLLFSYDTRVEPGEEDREMREKCIQGFRSLLAIGDTRQSIREHVNAFAFNRLYDLCSNFLAHTLSKPIVVDITCLTRVHLMALSSALVNRTNKSSGVYICYTTPRSYGFQSNTVLSWKDVLFVPIGKRRFPRREGHACGVIFPGHYGERLSVALQELEPASGRLIYTKQESRPDLLLRSREANHFIEERLRLLVMPRADGKTRQTDYWTIDIVNLGDFERLAHILSEVVSQARADEGPIMVYPFGPKPQTMFTALFLASQEDVQSWVVYPVPERFDARYSEGVRSLNIYNFAMY